MLKRSATKAPIRYLFRDDFAEETAAAPLTSPRTAIPGPGTLTLVQTDGEFSVSSGKFSFPAQATPVLGDQGFHIPAFSRVAGRALIVTKARKAATTTTGPYFGWNTAQSAAVTNLEPAGLNFRSDGNFARIASAGSMSLSAYAATTDYDLAVILRSTGVFFAARGGAYADWTLLWAEETGSTATLYPTFGNSNAVGTLQSVRVVDLGGHFASDYGIATDRVAGAVSAAQAFVHRADFLLRFTVTTVPSAGSIIFVFRKQDADNYWSCEINSSGDILIRETVATVATTRITASGVVANGDVVTVDALGTALRLFEQTTARGSYASASNFQTATAAELNSLGTGGAVSNATFYPKDVSGFIDPRLTVGA